MFIKTHPDIESDADLSRYLLPLQVEGVTCSERYQYTEKANRIGWTWLDALKNVRKRLAFPGRDYLFTTQNWNGALEYGRYLDLWITIFNLGKNLISKTEETITVLKEDGKGGQIAVQEKVGIYTFDGGSRIILFSSSPWAIQTFEGDVGWDEAAFHDQQEKMYTALITRIAWGYDISVWSAHNGMGSWFNQVLGRLAKAPDSGWHCRKVDIYQAIAEGLVEKINQRSGKQMTREEFLADCKKRALTPAIFAERFECNPADAGSSIVPWSIIDQCRDQVIIRQHLGDAAIKAAFGPSTDGLEGRVRLMNEWMAKQFGVLFKNPQHYRLGFDVAASGQGDLASFWVDAKRGSRLEHRALLTTQTEDWHFLKTALWWFMELPAIKGAGDSTGLGKQITWETAQKFSDRFTGIPFSAPSKSSMGLRLMNQLQAGERRLAKGEDDVAVDLFSLQKTTAGTGVAFTAVANPLNAASHCDMAWSAALSGAADAGPEAPPLKVILI